MKNSALNYALWLLGRRDRSIGELRDKLSKKEYQKEEISQTIEFLLEKKFLDDRRFARNYIKNQLNLKPLGKYQLKIKLKKKLVPNDLIDETLRDIGEDDEKALAKEAAEKWKRNRYQASSMRYQGDKNKLKNSLLRFLTSRGFDYDNIKEITDSMIA